MVSKCIKEYCLDEEYSEPVRTYASVFQAEINVIEVPTTSAEN